MSEAENRAYGHFETRWRMKLYMGFFLFLSLSAIVNAQTMIADHIRLGANFQASYIWSQEIIGAYAWFFALPVIDWITGRFPVNRQTWQRYLGVYLVGAVLVAVIHIAAMTGLRILVYSIIMGEALKPVGDYIGGFLYEFWKNIPPYVFVAILFTIVRSHAEQSAALAAASALNRAPGRIVLKSGGSSIWLDAAHFVSAEAAGNYVNVTTEGARYFVRSTLSGLEQDLQEAGSDIVRCHRSWLVARGHIREITPTGDGDATITLSNDKIVPASRRYRDRLE